MEGLEGLVYRFGDFRLDVRQKVLERAGVMIAAPPKAVDLLIILVGNAGRVVDKKALFEAVWPGAFVVESSLTKNVSILRKLLDPPDAVASMIQTVSKRGYRFVEAVRKENPIRVEAISMTPARRLAPMRAIAATALLLVATIAFLGLRPSKTAPGLSESDRQLLVGQYLLGKLERSEMIKAQQRFSKAVELDPNSAVAHAALADSYIFSTMLGLGNTESNLRAARTAAEQAIALQPKTARAHISLGLVRLFADFDAAGAETEYRRALQLDPRSTYAHYVCGCMLAISGRFDEARAMNRRARELDPVSPLIGVQTGRIEYYARRYEAAIDRFEEVLEREPGFSQAHYYLALSLGQLGRTDEALRHLRLAKMHPSLLATDEAWLQSVAGDPGPANRLVAERRKLVESGAKATILVMPALAAGDRELGMWAVEQMAKAREPELLEMRAGPRFDALRSDLRFSIVIRNLWHSETVARPTTALLNPLPDLSR